MTLRPFHLAVTVDNLAAARAFYGGVLGCPEGRSAERWIDFNLFGHQFVAHLDEGKHSAEAESSLSFPAGKPARTNQVDGHGVPVPHFGIVLSMPDWQALAQRLRDVGTHFVIEPTIRFKGAVGEQATMFFRDPAGNALEFKAFADDSQLFAT